MMKSYLRVGDMYNAERLAQYLVDLPLSIVKELLVTLDITELKCYLIYAYAVNKQRYKKSTVIIKGLLGKRLK